MKNILIGITSSIASYKVYELIRLFRKNDYNVKVVLTQNALNFVSPLVIETLSNNKCFFDEFAPRDNVEHISLCDWADIFLIAPITANTISKIATGIADNLLTSIACAYIGTKKPMAIAPSMNCNMWENEIIQKNIKTLNDIGINIIEPQNGFLACGTNGIGRLEDIDIIYHKTLRYLFQNKKNNSKKILVTIGGTKEDIDNVRYISNKSSGKMGKCLSDALYEMGYSVKAISTIELKKPYEVINVNSADDMLNAIKKQDFDCLIMAAAVGDFKVKEKSNKKISKEDIRGDFCLNLTKNPDVVSEISKNKKKNQKIIGFCLTDKDLIKTAKNKLKAKNLDYIVANEVNVALNSDVNKVTIIDKNGKILDIEKDSKDVVARKILEAILSD